MHNVVPTINSFNSKIHKYLLLDNLKNSIKGLCMDK